MFNSSFEARGPIQLPAFSGTRIMMMPVVLGDMDSIPGELSDWRVAIRTLFGMQDYDGKVGYLTIDEKVLQANATHRRAGLHVDGVYRGGAGGWGGGGWGSVATGMLTVSTPSGCRVWAGEFQGWPGDEGSCDHLQAECDSLPAEILKASEVYWLGGLCVHESVPVEVATPRQFVRLSLPSEGPWFEGYTENPLGVLPSHAILPRREFMVEK